MNTICNFKGIIIVSLLFLSGFAKVNVHNIVELFIVYHQTRIIRFKFFCLFKIISS